MKVVKKFIFVLILLLVFFTANNNVNAKSINRTLNQLELTIDDIYISDYTDDESFEFEKIDYEFKDYIDSIIGVDNPQPENTLCV